MAHFQYILITYLISRSYFQRILSYEPSRTFQDDQWSVFPRGIPRGKPSGSDKKVTFDLFTSSSSALGVRQDTGRAPRHQKCVKTLDTGSAPRQRDSAKCTGIASRNWECAKALQKRQGTGNAQKHKNRVKELEKRQGTGKASTNWKSDEASKMRQGTRNTQRHWNSVKELEKRQGTGNAQRHWNSAKAPEKRQGTEMEPRHWIYAKTLKMRQAAYLLNCVSSPKKPKNSGTGSPAHLQ